MAQGWLPGWIAGGALASTLFLSGCADGIDLNGKLFDTMGISKSAMDAKKVEPKLAERAPLVMPPASTQLPAPGSGVEPTNVAFPDDPEARKAREGKERERLHLAYCRGEIQWKERALTKDPGAPVSPYGPCPSVFGTFTGSVNKN